MLKRFLLVSLLCAAPVFAKDAAPQTLADINRLLELTGAMAMGQQMADALVKQILAMGKSSKLPPRVIEIMQDEASATMKDNMADLQKQIASRYADHFSDGEIRQLIAFYQSEVGRKTVREMPLLMQECMEAGQQWGQTIQPQVKERITARLKKEGYESR